MAYTVQRLTESLRLFWGRPRRLFLNLLRPGYVRTQVALRHGECKRCGACCQLGSRCRHLSFENGLAVCDCYGDYRPPNCRTFPIDQRDLADRDQLLARLPCGFFWVGQEAQARSSQPEGDPRWAASGLLPALADRAAVDEPASASSTPADQTALP